VIDEVSTASEVGGPSRRGRPTAETTQRRMRHLLHVAREIFVRQGYRAAKMDEIAVAAGITKRTIYAWHSDKEALFRACIESGTDRFPKLKPHDGDVFGALERYVEELHRELSGESSYGLGILFLREAQEFPELAEPIQRSFQDYLIEPLAAFLRRHRLEEIGTVERTMLFVAMALAPLHNMMLLGTPLPPSAQLKAHARRCVAVFLHGSLDG